MVTTNPAVIAIGSVGLLIVCLLVGKAAGEGLQTVVSPKLRRAITPGWLDLAGTMTALAIGFGLAFMVMK